MQELVTVIIPAYNAEKFIAECLESVMEQTYENLEIIVVNDGSSDNTADVVEKIADLDSRIRLINTQNRGVSAARNTGMDNSSKDGYWMFLDADDRIFPDSVETLKWYMDEYGADIVGGYGTGGVNGVKSEKPVIEDKTIRIWENDTAIKMSLKDDATLSSACRKLYKKSVINDVRFDEDIRIHEDGLFIFRCTLKKPKFLTVSEVVYQYNSNPHSFTRSGFSEHKLGVLKVLERKEDIIYNQYPEFVGYLPNLRLKSNMVMLFVLSECPSLRHIKQEFKCIRQIRINKKHFKPTRSHEVKWFKIVKKHLYVAYRLKCLLRLCLRKNKN